MGKGWSLAGGGLVLSGLLVACGGSTGHGGSTGPAANAPDAVLKKGNSVQHGPGTSKASPAPPAGHASEPDDDAAAERAALDAALAELDRETMAALSADSVAEIGVLNDSEILAGLLDEAARGAVVPLPSLGHGTLSERGGGSFTPGAAVAPGTPSLPKLKGEVRSLTARVKDGPIPNAEKEVERMEGRFRRCYEDGLNVWPELAFVVQLHAAIEPNGTVDWVSADPADGHPVQVEVVSCLEAVVRSALFSPPESGRATVVIDAELAPAP